MFPSNPSEYKITRHQEYDKYGKPKEPFFRIHYKKSFLFFNRWKTYCYQTGAAGHSWKQPFEYPTLEEAEETIKDHLCKLRDREPDVSTVKYLNC